MQIDSIQPTLIRDSMKYWLLHPDARLRPHVHCYFVVDAGQHPYYRNELLLPDGYAELVFAFEAGFERWGIGEQTERTVMTRSYLIGGRSHSVLTGGARRLRLVGVKLDPRLLRRLIVAPLAEFRDATLTLQDLNNRPLLLLEDAVAECKSVMEIATTLDGFFLGQLRSGRSGAPWPHDELIDYVLRRIQSERGMGSITHLTRELGIDARTLERRFLAWFGMTPKKYARIVRFKHSYHRFIARARDGIADHHLEGYYDQSHFNKEFKYFTGIAPSALIAARTPSSTAVTDHLLRVDLSPASLSSSEGRLAVSGA